MRKLFIAGNWKMHTDKIEAESIITKLISQVSGFTGIDIAVCPPYVYLPLAIRLTSGSDIQVGAQNCYLESKGAFTGEISPVMLKDIGCDFVIIGHSERRHVFGETDGMIHLKVKKALESDLKVILCIGELLEEREAGKTESVVETQLRGGLQALTSADLAHITIAYEPVWAIGTGKTATPEQAQEVHAFIRDWLKDRYGLKTSQNCRIQYGGSVKPENANELLNQPDIDGALVGGASLKSESFAGIIKAGI
jgi:triosephosphate isomerase